MLEKNSRCGDLENYLPSLAKYQVQDINIEKCTKTQPLWNHHRFEADLCKSRPNSVGIYSGYIYN